jgi:ankyrin repeat protein
MFLQRYVDVFSFFAFPSALLAFLFSAMVAQAQSESPFFDGDFVKTASPNLYSEIVADGGDIFAIGPDNRTTLHYAVRYGTAALVGYLVDSGVDVNRPNIYLNTPLHWSVGNWDDAASAITEPEKVRLLLAAGANPNATTDRGETPIMFAVTVEIAQILLEAGANPALTQQDGLDAIAYNEDVGRAEVANFLRSAQTGSTPVQDFDKGIAAHNAGDYDAALQEWRPLAEQGDAAAQSNIDLMYNKIVAELALAKVGNLDQ